MTMSNENKIEEGIQNLEEVAQKQQKYWKERYSSKLIPCKGYLNYKGLYLPKSFVIPRFATSWHSFAFLLTETFWKVFNETRIVIDDPAGQFSLRTLLDLCYTKVLYFFNQKSAHRKEQIAIRYWLCNIGLWGGNNKEEEYESLLLLLSRKDDKKRFTRLKHKGFPQEDFLDELQRIWPGLNNKKIWQQIIKDVEPLYPHRKKEETRALCNNLWRMLSLLEHGDPITVKGLLEDSKSHLFRSYTILFLTGMQLVKTINKRILDGKQDKEIEKLVEYLRNEVFPEVRNLYFKYREIKNS